MPLIKGDPKKYTNQLCIFDILIWADYFDTT